MPRTLSPAAQLSLSIILMAFVGLVDYATGNELNDDAVYFLPLALAGWYGSTRNAVVVAAASGAVWAVSSFAAGLSFSSRYYWAANIGLQILSFSIVGALVAELRGRYIREKQLARLDPLTGLANGRAFFERAGVEIERSRRHRRPLMLAYLDLDNFKSINDAFGHETGDAALRLVADTLRTSTRSVDVVARIGGDEFVLLMPETGVEQGHVLIERIRTRIQRALAAQRWEATASIGCMVYAEPPADPERLVAQVDELMFAAKRAGKNRVRLELATGGEPKIPKAEATKR
ncbi:MAG: GGDEF domain-containing protein [Deltaproteobacteria bacterium]|nr:GGDEF domain-containing protein [Deltaproteobacteria bacterium]